MSAISELSHLKVEKPKTAEERRARRKEAGRDNRAGYLFLLPWLIGLVVITIGPLLASLYLSFTRYSLIQAPEWIGVENYVRMFSDPRWWKSLQVTFTYVIVGVPVQLVVALAVLWRQMFGVDGLVNQVLRAVGIDSHIGWISDPQYALWSLILLHVWTFGSPMVIFLAGLRQIPGMYYEAASVDGATRWTKFRRITLPLLSPIIFFNLVLQVIGAFQSFTQAFVVSGGTGGPSDSTLFYTLYLYQKGFGQFQMGYAAAMAWLLVIIVGAMTAINFFLSRYWVFYDD